MASNKGIGVRQSVSTRLLRVVFGFYIIIAITVTLSHLVFEYRYQKKSISRDLESIQKTFEHGLAGQLWHLDQEAFLATIEGMLEIPTIVGVVVANNEGGIIATGGIVNLNGDHGNVGLHVNLLGLNVDELGIAPDKRYKLDLFQHAFPISYLHESENEQLGKVTLFSNTTVIFQRVKLQFLLLVVNAVIKTVALLFIFLWFSNRFIRQPLAELAAATQAISLDNLSSSKIKIKRQESGRDELKVLEESFNHMIEDLYHSLVQQKKDENELFRRKSEFEAIIDAIDDAVVFVDTQRCIVQINPAFTRIFGYELAEVQGREASLIYARHHDFTALGEERYSGKGPTVEPVYEMEYRRKDGTVFPGETLGARVKGQDRDIIGFVGVIRDITGRKKREIERLNLEEQLKQAYKMEAIGTLAGGIAHDFNNILFAIIGFSNLAIDKIPEDNPAHDMIKKVLEGGYRASELVRQILSFSRKSQQDRIPMQTSPMVKEALKLLRATLPATIEIKQQIQADSGVILADPTQIHQIVMNLCTNAKHAMEENGGVLSVGLQNVTLAEGDIATDLTIKPGDYLMLSVRDTGKGIQPEILSHIFDPYFTTKDINKGSGMGLAVVRGIVSSHDGMITVESTPGAGSVFKVFFPLIPAVSGQEIKKPAVPVRGNERILVIDDEKSIVEIMKQQLEDLGYVVTTMTSSIDALALFEKSPDAFDLIITDQTMPHMTGKEFAEKIVEIRADVPILLCTGYSENISAENAQDSGISVFLMKPLSRDELVSSVRQALDAKAIEKKT